jgi:hypothetical protein
VYLTAIGDLFFSCAQQILSCAAPADLVASRDLLLAHQQQLLQQLQTLRRRQQMPHELKVAVKILSSKRVRCSGSSAVVDHSCRM